MMMGVIFSLTKFANDGVSCDSEFLINGLLGFFEGKHGYLFVTNTYHNVHTSQYQVIFGNSVATIGNCFINTGM